jgi:hypothetical protein
LRLFLGELSALIETRIIPKLGVQHTAGTTLIDGYIADILPQKPGCDFRVVMLVNLSLTYSA